MSRPPYQRRFTFRPVPGGVEADMQDFCHHVRVRLTAADGRITTAQGKGIRLPWTTCPLGTAGVGRLVGMTVEDARHAARWPGGRTAHCTHSMDLAIVALAHLNEPRPFRYAIAVEPASAPVRTARIERDGRMVLELTTRGQTVMSPPQWQGFSLERTAFAGWTAALDPTLREAATLLRRALHIAPSRDLDLDTLRVASDSIRPDASCHTLQAGVIDTARRLRGSSRAELTDDDAF